MYLQPVRLTHFDWHDVRNRAAIMASARGAGSVAFRMQLRTRKRDFAAAAAATSSTGAPATENRKKRVVKPKTASSGTTSGGRKVKVVPPTSSKFPVLTALKERVSQPSNDAKIMLRYPNLVPARLIRRYKRFLADVVLLDGASKDGMEKTTAEVDGDENAVEEEVLTIYCPNTGPMVGLLDGLPNARVQLSKSDDPKRKYAYTLEMIQIQNGERDVWVGVHSTSANRMIEEALASRWLPELGDYDSVRREVKFAKNSRVDFVLTTNAEDGTVAHEKYVEVKSATLAVDGVDKTPSRCAVFPDTISTRAQKHVTELTELLSTKADSAESNTSEKPTKSKVSGAIIFLVQRDDCDEFAPSFQHDKKFAELCAVAAKSGIQLLAYTCSLEPDEVNCMGSVRLLGSLPLEKAYSSCCTALAASN
ncbi:unnamed protein product [Phytophthora lilii]|uniref:Unnamed protein product n=1 Tax=Phytophthora lilii TaxID=2077276 RepID=A0A9W6TV83_9STRA|nr:unnamed protein product [Phytophthora lilii]